MKNFKKSAVSLLLALCMALSSCAGNNPAPVGDVSVSPSSIVYDEPSPTPHEPSPTPHEWSSPIPRSEPYINVFTEFPSGEVLDDIVDIEYEAYPSDGAEITAVYYTINGEPIERRQRLYPLPGLDWNFHEEFGKGRVVLKSNVESNIVFTVEDSAGKTAQFVVENKPYFDSEKAKGEMPDFYDANKRVPSEITEGYEYLTNIITVVFKEDFAPVDVWPKELYTIAQEIDGEIIGYYRYYEKFYIRIPDSTEQELIDIGQRLMEEYGDILRNVSYWEYTPMVYDTTYPTDDPWWNQQVDEKRDGSGVMKPLNPPVDAQWGLDAIKAPAAWALHGRSTNGVKVGVLDGGFFSTHEDIPSNINILRNPTVESHGTHVTGTIAAVHNETI